MTSKELDPHLVVTIESRDGDHQIICIATHYRLPDEDHSEPWVESWSARDEVGEEPEYRDDEEGDAGEALDAALVDRLAEYCGQFFEDECFGY